MKKAYVLRERDRTVILEKDCGLSALGKDHYKQIFSFDNDASFTGGMYTKLTPLAKLPDSELIDILLANRGYTH